MIKTLGFGKINWDGVKSVLKHSAWIAGLTVAFYLLGILKDFNFGAYAPIAMWVIGTLASFLKKLCETYQVQVPENY